MGFESQILKQEYDYLVYMLLVKIIAFVSLRYEYLGKSEITNIVVELNTFFNKGNLFNEGNIIKLGKMFIDDNFTHILTQMKEHVIDPEIILSGSKFDQIRSNLENDKKNLNFKNRGDMLSDYANGKYYRFFRNIRSFTEKYDSSRTDICAGEAIYHSFARFYAEGIDKYFEYFKEMSDNDLVNYQNQSQEYGFCNCKPCYYWFLNSKKDLHYFNELIKTKDIKLNHIEGNEHGPSALYLIIDMLLKNSYWDRRKNEYIELDDEFRNILFETLFNIVTSNYSISYDAGKLIELFSIFSKEYYIRKSMAYIISDIGIERQISNNKYPIIRGREVDFVFNESRLNGELDSMIHFVRKLTREDML